VSIRRLTVKTLKIKRRELVEADIFERKSRNAEKLKVVVTDGKAEMNQEMRKAGKDGWM
jgi:hypothetical protein